MVKAEVIDLEISDLRLSTEFKSKFKYRPTIVVKLYKKKVFLSSFKSIMFYILNIHFIIYKAEIMVQNFGF